MIKIAHVTFKKFLINEENVRRYAGNTSTSISTLVDKGVTRVKMPQIAVVANLHTIEEQHRKKKRV